MLLRSVIAEEAGLVNTIFHPIWILFVYVYFNSCVTQCYELIMHLRACINSLMNSMIQFPKCQDKKYAELLGASSPSCLPLHCKQ